MCCVWGEGIVKGLRVGSPSLPLRLPPPPHPSPIHPPHLDDKRLALDLPHAQRTQQLANGKHRAPPRRRLAPVGAVQPHGLCVCVVVVVGGQE